MEITLMRKDSLGIQGTYQNVEHHAQEVLPFVKILEQFIPSLTYLKEWKQGHNVHSFVTQDGRQFSIRALRKDGKYTGVVLLLRLSRTEQVPIAYCSKIKRINIFLTILANVTKSTSKYDWDKKPEGNIV